MKKLVFLFFIFLLSLPLKSQQNLDEEIKKIVREVLESEQKKKNEELKIEILQPMSGKNYEKGDTVVVIWTYNIESYGDSTVYVQATSDFGNNWMTIGKVQLKEKRLEWYISQEKTEIGRVRITNDTAKKNDISDFNFKSDAFEIRDRNGINFAIVSAIKSIAGVKPAFEFIDINFNFNIFERLSILASIDVAMTEDTSAQESKKKITEAGIFINPILFKFSRRQINLGGFVKIFNSVPYYGIQIGSMETSGFLESSYLTIGLARRIVKPDSYNDSTNTVAEQFPDNIYIEFALYSEKLGLPLKYLRIKGGLIIPAWYSKGFDRVRTKDIVSRIALEIPLGGLFKF